MNTEIKEDMKKSKLKLLWEIYVTFLKLGTFGFGGGYSLIPHIEREIVEKISFLEGLIYLK